MCEDGFFKFGVLEEAGDGTGEISKEDFLILHSAAIRKDSIVTIEKSMWTTTDNNDLPAVFVRYVVGSRDFLHVITCDDEESRDKLMEDINHRLFGE